MYFQRTALLLVVYISVLCCVGATRHIQHDCIHDQIMKLSPPLVPPPLVSAITERQGTNAGLRIHFETSYLFNDQHACTSIGQQLASVFFPPFSSYYVVHNLYK
jgi:hypothetical protein